MNDSPVAILYTTDSVELALKTGASPTADSRGFIGLAYDGSNVRFVRCDSNGRQEIVGIGSAGSPSGGVISIQGVVGGTVVPISVSSLPLPTGAATETTLSAMSGKLPASLGQKAMAASLSVAVASDQGALSINGTVVQGNAGTHAQRWMVGLSDGSGFISPVLAAQLPAALVGGRLDINTGTWLGSTAPTVGQKAMTASVPVVIANNQSAVPISASSLPLPTGAATETTLSAMSGKLPASLGQKAMAASLSVAVASDQGAVPVSGTVTANVGTTNGLALDATLTGGTQTSRVTDGTNTAAVKAASTPAAAADPALVVAISPNNPLTVAPATASTSAVTNVSASTSNVTLLSANSGRRGAMIYNDSVNTMYLKLGTTASATSYTAQLGRRDYYEVPFNYTGQIDAIWTASAGTARITELTV